MTLAHSHWMLASHCNKPLTHTSCIQPAVTLSLAYRGSLKPGDILYNLLSGSSDAREERLKSRRPFVPVAQNLLNNLTGLAIRGSQ